MWSGIVCSRARACLHAARLHWFIYLKGLALLLLALVCIMFAIAVGSNEPGIAIPLWLGAGVLALLGAGLGAAALIEQATTELVLTDRGSSTRPVY